MDRTNLGRWIAVVAGFAVLVAVIAIQHQLSADRGSTPTPTPPPSTSPSVSAPVTDSSAPSTGSASDTPASSDTSHPPMTKSRPVPGAATSSTSAPPATEPATSSAPPAPWARGAQWEVVMYESSGITGAGHSAVVRYTPATSTIVRTPVPALDSNGPLSFAVTTGGAIILPWDNVTGYLVPPGGVAQPLDGLLAHANQVFPGPDAGHVWADGIDATGSAFALVDAHGVEAGPHLAPPPSLVSAGYLSFISDGGGFVLAEGTGGTYDVRADGTRLVTHGRVLAAGPTVLVVQDCDENGQCHTSTLDRTSDARRTLKDFPGDGGYPQLGVVSADGRLAATIGPGSDTTAAVTLTHLATGARYPIPLTSTPALARGTSSMLAFTPDSRYLLVAGNSTVMVIDAADGRLAGTLPVTQVSALAVVPTDR